MIDIEESADGIIVPVRAQPRARRNCVTGTHAWQLKISVTVPQEKWKANDAISAVLVRALDVRSSQVTLLSGHTSQKKRFLTAGTTVERVRDKLTQLTANASSN